MALADRATLDPTSASAPSPAVSFPPAWPQLSPLRRNPQAAPTPALSPGPPISAELPSLESATVWPNWPWPTSPEPVSCPPCWAHADPERANTHAAPTSSASPAPPISAVLPSSESATLSPNEDSSSAPLPVSFPPCWLQEPSERTNTQAAPTSLSVGAPISAVVPSPESATLAPKLASPDPRWGSAFLPAGSRFRLRG